MPGKNEREAYENYSRPLINVFGCVTDPCILKPPRSTGYGTEDAPIIVAFKNNPIALNGSDLSLYFLQSVYVGKDEKNGGYKVFTCTYSYKIVNRDGHEIIVYQWEPKTSSVHYPHLHIGFGARSAACPLSPKFHIPSGRVPIEDVVYMLIAEFGVKPRRSDWSEVILDARAKFMDNKRW